ncbi:AAA family ATPase [Microtetraspora sp. AC03309]|uniref:ATP-binding protein n=1 Tax=Microtetraspora sp. AC03309 TaxID=2779376 RepID=UPI001E4AD86D|nr:LuxR family transcriptional regulator [Microtetraspora sp. AC03309]MCC5580507.1 AAA family ATPase [Microtetraspora sp. AC03309]
MEGRTAGPAVPGAPTPLVGRRDALGALHDALGAIGRDGFRFLALAGEPGAGKTRLLGELATMAADLGRVTMWGRAAEFEQMMPFSPLVDALDDHLETRRADITDILGPTTARLLATVFPSLTSHHTGHHAEPARSGAQEESGEPGPDRGGLARYRLYRAVRQMVDTLSAPRGLVLILDDVHWADESSLEFLDHVTRHPPTGPVLLAVAFRPAQAPPRLATLPLGAGARGHEITVGPLAPEEADELLGPRFSKGRGRALYEASGGNPFYLEALARMDGDAPEPMGALPPTVLAALQVELGELSPGALLVAQGAAVAADEFDPAIAAVAAEVPRASALDALDELAQRDIVRAHGGRFRFRHPLVRRAVYESAAAGWRVAAHGRIAARLAALGAPAVAQAGHLERSGSFGDQRAVEVLVDAARAVAAHAPATSAHWLQAAVRLMPDAPATRDSRMELLLELSRAQGVSGRLAEGRDTARELLRMLPGDDYPRRGRAARLCALMERQLDRPHEARALLLDELGRMPNPRAAAAVPLRMRLVAESLMRVDFDAAQAVLDLMPDAAEDWEPGLAVAVAALRPMSAYAAGRTDEAVRYAESAGRLMAAAPDDHLAEWLDAIAWLCWAEMNLGRYGEALRHFDRAAAVAAATGQSYILTHLLAGKARTLVMAGRLADALATAEESEGEARLLDSGQQLVFALTQRCLAASWSGDDDAAILAGEEAVQRGVGGGEVWGAMARHARGQALINAGRLEEGAEAVLDACDRFSAPRLDRGTLLLCCETLARAAAELGRQDQSAAWADRAATLEDPGLPAFRGLIPLARAHALRADAPARAAAAAREAAGLLAVAERRLDAGRALLVAGLAHLEAGERARAREDLKAAAAAFETCGARNLKARTDRELRRLGVRVAGAPAGKADTPFGLSPRELEVAMLVADGLTNQQVAQRLFLSVRTVETHLSRIFAKLDVSSRVGVATALSRSG